MKTIRSIATAAMILLSAPAAWSADIFILNFDLPGVGFNDPTPVEPVGGNTGTTLGEQRLNVFNFAAQAWGAELQSDVPIFVAAFFGPQPCTPTGGVLASAGPTFVVANNPSLPLENTWYVGALADALIGVDQDPGFVDIVTRFNGDIGVNPDCLTGQSWYNGYDNNNDPSSEIDLLSVVMHELSHGLGFLELADESTGALFFGLPDAYLVNMFDIDLGATWDRLTDEERLQSQTNADKLVWIGPSVTSDAPFILGARPSVEVLTPKALKGSYEAQPASFGPPLRANGGLTGKMVNANDSVGVGSDGCEPIVNNVRGKVALIDRGGCAFTQKVANAQAAGAKGAIIVNNVPTGRPPMGGGDPSITIPSVGVSQADGNAFKAAAARNIVGKLILDDDFRAGTTDGFVRLYAPTPVAPGSSKSHWDTSATPNLVMEPFITDDLVPPTFLDLTPNLFEDIGWTLQ